MTIDEMIARIELIDSVLNRDVNIQWYQQGLTLKHGTGNGHNGWNAFTTDATCRAMGSTIEEALAALLVVMENALDAFALKTEQNTEFIREIKRGKKLQ
jgi:hypothetical protein